MHFLPYSVTGQMNISSHQQQVLIRIVCTPGDRQTLAAGDSNVDFWISRIKSVKAVFCSSPLGSPSLPATCAPNPRFCHPPHRGSAHYPEGITWPLDFKGSQEQLHFVMRILPQFVRVRVTRNSNYSAGIRDLISREQNEEKG
jgi:hypothetical protein